MLFHPDVTKDSLVFQKNVASFDNSQRVSLQRQALQQALRRLALSISNVLHITQCPEWFKYMIIFRPFYALVVSLFF